MPRYAYQRPVNRVYAYKPAYVNTYDKPATTQFTETKIEREVLPERTRRAPSEQPARRTLGEVRLGCHYIRDQVLGRVRLELVTAG